MTYAQIYAHEIRNQNKSSEIVLHLIDCKSSTLLDTWNYSKPRFESLTHRAMQCKSRAPHDSAAFLFGGAPVKSSLL